MTDGSGHIEHLHRRLEMGGGLRVLDELRGVDLPSRDALLGRELSGYRIEGHLADGGMSSVYRARRADGRFDRDVAIKVSAGSIIDATLRERFFQEQRILATLNHPCIAQLYDAGISEEGWPYIVMELIDGVPIDEYCAGVDVHGKLTLLAQICGALSVAHSQLVVHRDIKPSNVLVNADGQPKLLDFGIAKLLSGGDAATRTLAMTPQYASPEQLLGHPPSVASDVYQVSLLMAQLLHPDLVQRETNLEQAIGRASSASDPILNREVAKALPMDLVHVVEQCVRAEPAQRYTEVSDVREELENYLSGYPVRASGNHRLYRARKFVQRNRLPLATSMAAVVVFAASSIWYLMEVTAARERAELEAATSRQVTDFVADLFRSSSPSELRGEDLTAGELLERGLARIDENLVGRPLVLAQLQSVLGSAYLDLGNYETAEQLLRQALDAQQRGLGEEHPSTLKTLSGLASVAAQRGNLQEAGSLFEDILETYERTRGPEHQDTLDTRSHLAKVVRQLGDFAEAAEIQAALLEGYRRTNQLATLNGIKAVTGLAISTIQGGDPQRAIPYFEQALELSREVLGPGHRQTITAINNMAVTYQVIGQPERALPYSFETYEQSLEVYGPDHPVSIRSATNLATTLRQTGRLEDARAYAQGALELARAHLPPSHAGLDVALTEVGQVELASGNYERAEANFRELLAIEREHLGETHMYTIGTQLKAASAIAGQNRLGEAAALIESAIETMVQTQGSGHHEVLLAEHQLAQIRAREGRYEEARDLLLRVVPGLSGHLGADARQVVEAREHLEEINLRLQGVAG